MRIIEYMKNNVLLFDGAMGSMLYNEGLSRGQSTESFGFENKDVLIKIHKEYLDAGANVITTNTFGANEINLDKKGYKVEEVIDNAVQAVKIAIDSCDNKLNKYIALDIGPIGQMIKPLGKLTEKEAYDIFARQMIQGEKSGVDLILIETMMDLKEAEIAVKAAKDNTDLPIFCTMTFGEHGKSFTGCSPETMAIEMEKLGVDAVGANCSLGPKQLLPIIEKMIQATNLSIMVQPNAGIPDIIKGEAVYNIKKEEFTNEIKPFIEKKVSIIGGCCGTTPEFISEINNLIRI